MQNSSLIRNIVYVFFGVNGRKIWPPGQTDPKGTHPPLKHILGASSDNARFSGSDVNALKEPKEIKIRNNNNNNGSKNGRDKVCLRNNIISWSVALSLIIWFTLSNVKHQYQYQHTIPRRTRDAWTDRPTEVNCAIWCSICRPTYFVTDFQRFAMQTSLSLDLVQLVLLKAVLALRTSANKLRSRDVTDLIILCSVCRQWMSAFDLRQRRRLKGLCGCKCEQSPSALLYFTSPVFILLARVAMRSAALAVVCVSLSIHKSLWKRIRISSYFFLGL